MKKLENHIGRTVKFDTKLTTTWGQWVYGIPQSSLTYDVLDNTICYTKQITKTNNYTCIPIVPDLSKPDTQRHIIIPFSCKQVAKFLDLNEFNDKTYHIQLHWKNRKVEKISDGYRYKYGLSWTLNLVAQYFKLTKKYGKDIPVEDLEWNLKRLCDLYFVDGINCHCYPQLISFLKELYEEYADKEYEEIESKMNGKIHVYRTEEYRRDLILQVRMSLRYDENTNTFIETNRQDLLLKLKEVGISEMTFRNHIHKLGFDIAYEEILPRKTYKNKGISKFNFSLYTKNEFNQYLIPKSEITPYMRKYASLNRFKIKGI